MYFRSLLYDLIVTLVLESTRPLWKVACIELQCGRMGTQTYHFLKTVAFTFPSLAGYLDRVLESQFDLDLLYCQGPSGFFGIIPWTWSSFTTSWVVSVGGRKKEARRTILRAFEAIRNYQLCGQSQAVPKALGFSLANRDGVQKKLAVWTLEGLPRRQKEMGLVTFRCPKEKGESDNNDGFAEMAYPIAVRVLWSSTVNASWYTAVRKPRTLGTRPIKWLIAMRASSCDASVGTMLSISYC